MLVKSVLDILSSLFELLLSLRPLLALLAHFCNNIIYYIMIRICIYNLMNSQINF